MSKKKKKAGDCTSIRLVMVQVPRGVLLLVDWLCLTMLIRVLKPCSGSGRELWLVLSAVGLMLEVTAKCKVSVVPRQDDHQRNVLRLYTCNTESLSLRFPTKTFTPRPLLQAHWYQSFLSNILNPVTRESDHLFHSILSLERLTNKEPYTAAICRLRERLGFSQFYHKCWMTLGKSLPSLCCFCETGTRSPIFLAFNCIWTLC